jgi:hypothetical protein
MNPAVCLSPHELDQADPRTHMYIAVVYAKLGERSSPKTALRLGTQRGTRAGWSRIGALGPFNLPAHHGRRRAATLRASVRSRPSCRLRRRPTPNGRRASYGHTGALKEPVKEPLEPNVSANVPARLSSAGEPVAAVMVTLPPVAATVAPDPPSEVV